MAHITIAKMRDATNTKIELFWSSLYFGHETLVVNSTYASFTNNTTLDIGFKTI